MDYHGNKKPRAGEGWKTVEGHRNELFLFLVFSLSFVPAEFRTVATRDPRTKRVKKNTTESRKALKTHPKYLRIGHNANKSELITFKNPQPKLPSLQTPFKPPTNSRVPTQIALAVQQCLLQGSRRSGLSAWAQPRGRPLSRISTLG